MRFTCQTLALRWKLFYGITKWMAFIHSLHMVISLNVLSEQFTRHFPFFLHLFFFLLLLYLSSSIVLFRIGIHPIWCVLSCCLRFCGCGFSIYSSFIAHILSVEECNLYHLIISYTLVLHKISVKTFTQLLCILSLSLSFLFWPIIGLCKEL